MSSDVFGSWQELGKLAVPSVIYIIQNNLLYLAIANLDAPTYQVVYNAKILTTGLFSYLLLGKRLSPVQWGSLVILMIGVSAAQYDPGAGSKVLKDGSNRTLGLLFVAVACITSGFAGVYFEKVLKSSQTRFVVFWSFFFSLFSFSFNL
jgi:solute carrier family 35 (UDP-sugar transporter), member A1/2/3